jgi:UMF1 family MFS transporter
MTPRAPEPGDTAPYRPQFLRDDSTHSKLSVPLSSQSNEADDEQSLSDPSYDMESTLDAPHYEGEDTRLTSDKELSGFYMYGWAAEVNNSYFLPCPHRIASPSSCPSSFVF